MKLTEKFELLHMDLIQAFRVNGKSDAIPVEVQQFIRIIDKVPELFQRYPGVNRCSREMVKLYPGLNMAYRTAQEYVFYAINYFHLNSEVKNEAWNNYFADKMMELHQIALKDGNLTEARRCLEKARDYRYNRNENAIDVKNLRPIIHVLSPNVRASMLDLPSDISMKTLWVEKKKKLNEALEFIDKLDVNDEEKERFTREAQLNMNISDVEVMPELDE